MYVDDFANVLLRLLTAAHEIPRTLIVAPAEEHTIRQLAEVVAEASHVGSNGISFSRHTANGQMRKYAVNALLMAQPCMADFEFTPLREGLRRTVGWMRSAAFSSHSRK